MNDNQENVTLLRWRFVLGRFAEKNLATPMDERAQRLEKALDFLYGREYAGRGLRGDGGSLDPSQLSVPHWLAEVREFFPQETIETIEKHALERYGMTELVTDPKVLEKLAPNTELLKTLLTFRGMLKGEVIQIARRIIREVVEEIKRKIESEVRQTLLGKLNRFRHSPLKVAGNFDWRTTIQRNLKHYDSERQKIIAQNLFFFSRTERRLPWHIILCIDQSGSMVDSVIHSAVMAGILANLPSLQISLVVFDTAVVDLTSYVDDPVEILMSVQLGGGTNIGQAMQYCEQLVANPKRTVFVLVSDFMEGASPGAMFAACQRMNEAGATLLGLAALDETAQPIYDRNAAEQLAARGMEIGALTPKKLAQWLAKKIY